MGVPKLESKESVSPKDYANILRSLYFSNYLKREFSELALSLMLETDYNSQLPKGIPKNIKISHKIGMSVNGMSFHNCGIIYTKEPYILCVMSKNSTQEESDKIISKISKQIYDYRLKKIEIS